MIMFCKLKKGARHFLPSRWNNNRQELSLECTIMSTSHITVDPSIFKAYDVRGVYGETLNDDVAYCIGRAAAQYLNVSDIAVGHDMRLSSPQITTALIRGITDQGVNAIDLGLTTTDGLYFAVGKFNYPAGIMVTASHNPGRYNGMK